MNTYLTIITTVLVLTQIIRVAQNTIRLRQEKKVFEGQCAELAEMEIRKEDFEIQRKAYRLIVEHFEKEQEE